MQTQSPRKPLYKTLNFNRVDLFYNRWGVLSPRQCNILRQKAFWQLKGGFFALTVLLFMMLAGLLKALFSSNRGDILIGLFLGIFCLIGVGIMGFLLAGEWQRVEKDIRRTQVISARGRVRLHIHQSTKGKVHIIRVGHLDFRGQKALWQALQNGAYYQVYYVPTTRIIMAAERLKR